MRLVVSDSPSVHFSQVPLPAQVPLFSIRPLWISVDHELMSTLHGLAAWLNSVSSLADPNSRFEMQTRPRMEQVTLQSSFGKVNIFPLKVLIQLIMYIAEKYREWPSILEDL